MGKVSPHDITPSDKDVPPESKDTNTGLAEGAANSGISQVSIEFTTEGLSVSKLFDTSPFNGRTLQVRNSSDGSGIVIRDLIKEGVIGTKLTDKNGYFIHGKKISGGLVNGGIKYSDSSNYSKYKNGIARYIPYYMILPNCVGGARGRVKELGISKTFPSRNPPGMWSYFPDAKKTETDGYVKIAENFYLKGTKDSEGHIILADFAGKGKAADGFFPLPGAAITWWNNSDHSKGHIEFIEGVYNFGTDDEYIITTSSSYADYSDNGILNLVKRKKISNNNFSGRNTNNLYGFSRTHGNTTFLYTSLCNFNNLLESISGEGGELFKTITVNYAAPTEEQLAKYEKIKNEIGSFDLELKAGQQVEIRWLGNLKKDGTGKRINKVLGRGKIKKIHDSGLPYPYEVVDNKNKLIAFYDRRSLKLV